MRTVAIVQARMGSTRLPGKVMKSIADIPMIGILIKRLALAKNIDEILVATSEDKSNQVLIDYVNQLGYKSFIGSEKNVLERFFEAAKESQAENIVRITGDCPLVEPDIVDKVIQLYLDSGVDYASNIHPPTFPDGLDVEVFSFQSLEEACQKVTEHSDREHVTPFIRVSGLFKTINLTNDIDLSHLRWTVDESADFDVISRVIHYFFPKLDFNWRDVAELAQSKPHIFLANQGIERNEGMSMSEGHKLWARAKGVIPGGNMLLSKRPEMYLPEIWPSYYSRSKGCQVWDLDGQVYTDMSHMSVGTNTLGYGHPEVDEAVSDAIKNGNMSTLNCPEEVLLAERLVEMHPWADMARLARTGGEANAIAIRIARAASGKDTVAFCGYHGWHDWYLAANLKQDNALADHLLPGLEPRGVPQNLKESVVSFNYNSLDELKALISRYEIGVIKMEVSRNYGPAPGFLEGVRKLATENGIVLVFDECTSGFRETFGGLHKKYGVEPDMAVFGKALGNGYAITAVIGKKEVMEAAQSSFISSTFWTERIGPSAALKVIDVMERIKSWEVITNLGLDLRESWEKLASRYHLSLDIWGIPALSGFTIKGRDPLTCKTFITQEMLKKGFLAANSVYCSVAHTTEVVDAYIEALDPIFKSISEFSDEKLSLHLDGPVCHAGFKRLN